MVDTDQTEPKSDICSTDEKRYLTMGTFWKQIGQIFKVVVTKLSVCWEFIDNCES